MNADEILAEAATAYRGGQKSHRDTLLLVGRLLHEFMIAFLKTGDGLTEAERVAKGIKRQEAVRVAMVALKVAKERISTLIGCYMVVDLLGRGIGLGEIGYASIYRLMPTVERIPAADGRGHIVNVSDCERWRIKGGMEVWAPALFARAVSEGLGQDEVRDEAAKMMPKRLRPFTSLTARVLPVKYKPATMEDVEKLVCGGNPNDVADLLYQLAMKSSDPARVAQRLAEALASVEVK